MENESDLACVLDWSFSRDNRGTQSRNCGLFATGHSPPGNTTLSFLCAGPYYFLVVSQDCLFFVLFLTLNFRLAQGKGEES